MRIAQITDLHIAHATEKPFDVNVRENFLKVLESVSDYDPDLIALTGDLTYHDGDSEACAWIKEQVDRLNKPVHIISGNHDNTKTLAQIFGREDDLKDGELYYEHVEQAQQILFLDSAVGKLSTTQKAWLNERLHGEENPALVFIHHPPAHANLPHMDNNYPLQDRDEVRSIFMNSDRLCNVFCGHYHMERVISAPNLNVFITPSCYIQISDQSEEFKIDHTVPAWRKIEIENDELRSSVVYCF